MANALADPTKPALAAMFDSVAELAKNPDVDPAKMQAIVDLQMQMIDRNARSEFQAAMHRARAKMPRITKDGAITNKSGAVQSRYSTYEAIDKVVRPIIEAEGLTYGFDFREGEQGRVLVTCIVSHVGGHEERFGPMPLSIDTTGAKNATQGAGSAGKYGQRYTLCAAFNIVTEGVDDDGNGGRRQAAPSAVLGFDPDKLVDDAQRAATGGPDAYAEFFAKLSAMAKGYLVDSGAHKSCKEAAQAHG